MSKYAYITGAAATISILSPILSRNIACCDSKNPKQLYENLYEERNPDFDKIKEANSDLHFSRVSRQRSGRVVEDNVRNACLEIRKALALRGKYYERFKDFNIDLEQKSRQWENAYYKFRHGVCHVEYHGNPLVPIPSVEEFMDDLQFLRKIYKKGFNRNYCYSRLKMLEYSYNLYWLMNRQSEQDDTRKCKRDFYTACKVDNHIHMSGAIPSYTLLQFLQEKVQSDKDKVIYQSQTLGELLMHAGDGLGIDDLTVERLQTQQTVYMFNNFEAFNHSYNILNSNVLRKVFLKIDGPYLHELVHIFNKGLAESSRNVYTEPRLSIYGRNRLEWQKLSNWVISNDLTHLSNVRFMVQIPRIYPIFRKNYDIESFGDMMQNFFEPLFQATLYPEKYPELAKFLGTVVGFDTVDDESIPDDCTPPAGFPSPEEWTSAKNPPYSYYSYYLWANIVNLNALRKSKGLNQFSFRPHSGETGRSHHLAAAFMLADSINHGIRLQKHTVLQYLYYLAQVGLSVSPLSNNALFMKVKNNPVHDFLMRGLNVTLSTDDPMQFHNTKQPLIEEYSVAQQYFKIDMASMCEMARNSVLQSGLSDALKRQEIGEEYTMPGALGCDSSLTGVPSIRAAYRSETLLYEYSLLMRKSEEMDVQPVHWTDLTYFIEDDQAWSFLEENIVDSHKAHKEFFGDWIPPQKHTKSKY